MTNENNKEITNRQLLESITKGFSRVNKKIDVKIGELDKKIDVKIGELDKKIDVKIGGLSKKIDVKISGLSKKIDTRIDEVLASVSRSFTNVETKMATKEDIKAIRAEMATKEDLRSFKEETKENFKEVNEKLDLVIEDVAGHSERIEALEEKVGI